MALSVDLRGRVLAAHERREGSQRLLAERFAVSLGAVNAWLRLARGGQRTPRQGGGSRAPHPSPAACSLPQRRRDRSVRGLGHLIGGVFTVAKLVASDVLPFAAGQPGGWLGERRQRDSTMPR